MSEVDLLEKIRGLEARLSQLETRENNMAQNQGWIDNAWQKDPLGLGYSGVVREAVTNTALSAGTNNLDSNPVPAGEVWVITNWTCFYTGTVASVLLENGIRSGGLTYVNWQANNLTTGIFVDRQGYWVLGPGDFLRMSVYNATLNDDAGFRFVGHRVDIDQ